MSTTKASEQDLLDRIGLLRDDLAQLSLFWHQHHQPGFDWIATPTIYARLAKAFVEIGAPLVGLEVASEGLETFPRDFALRQLNGLALARSGSPEEASQALEELRLEGHLDDETVGVLARTHKDLGLSASGSTRRHHLTRSLQLYAEAYGRSRSRWMGINVATLAILNGEAERAAAVARQVMKDCLEELSTLGHEDPERYWALATLGEAALGAGRITEAEEWYGQAAEEGRRRYGDLSSTRRHARLLLEHLERDLDLIDEWLPLPRVVLFSGHMVDRPGRDAPRFPPSRVPAVFAAIKDWLKGQSGLIGFSSAACGADLLFLEAIHELGGETHVVLPCDLDAFAEDSVEIAESGSWRERFDRQLATSRVVYASNSRPLEPGLAYEYVNDLIHGLGLLRARDLGTDVLGLAVWDGRAGDGPGGSASAVAQWQRHGLEIHRVRIEALAPDGAIDVTPLSEPPNDPVKQSTNARVFTNPTNSSKVLSLLFADAVGFSRLSDAELAAFVPACLGLVAELADRDRRSILVRETWGDALFLAFTDSQTAGRFALDLRDAMTVLDWHAKGFPRPLTMRFALHAGPVQMTVDPLTGLPKCSGAHVARAARLEPRTPPGVVYASEAFAALATLERTGDFRCDYVKQLDWAKRYGTFPAFVVRRTWHS